MKSLIYFSLLEFTDDFHIFFADGIVLEVIELSGVLAEVKHVDSTLVILIEIFNVFLDI